MSVDASSVLQAVERAITAESIAPDLAQRIRNGVTALSFQDRESLARMLRTAKSGALGVMIANFLGIKNTLAGAVIGGAVGYMWPNASAASNWTGVRDFDGVAYKMSNSTLPDPIQETAFAAGVAKVAALAGMNMQEFQSRVIATGELEENPDSRAYADFCIKFALDNSRPGSCTHAYYTAIKRAGETAWAPELQGMAVEPVHEALGAFLKILSEPGVKSATIALSPIVESLQLGAQGLKGGTNLLKLLYGLSVLGGTAVGTATWQMDRDAALDDVDMEAQRAKADRLQQLTDSLEESTKSRMQRQQAQAGVRRNYYS